MPTADMASSAFHTRALNSRSDALSLAIGDELRQRTTEPQVEQAEIADHQPHERQDAEPLRAHGRATSSGTDDERGEDRDALAAEIRATNARPRRRPLSVMPFDWLQHG